MVCFSDFDIKIMKISIQTLVHVLSNVSHFIDKPESKFLVNHLDCRYSILTSGDGVQMSVSSFGTTIVTQSLPEMVIFLVKTVSILNLWWWILEG